MVMMRHLKPLSMTVVQQQVQLYRSSHYSIREMSRMLRCSRQIVRLMLAGEWHHPHVQAYLYRACPVPAAVSTDVSTRPSAHSKPRQTRVGYREAWRQHQGGVSLF